MASQSAAGSVASDFFEKFKRIPFSVWALVVSLASGGIGYGVLHNYQQREKPTPQMARLVEGINRYYREQQQFPNSLAAILEGNGWREWKKIGEKTWQSRHYQYCYHFLDAQRIVIWGVPVGRYREQGETYLVMGRNGNYEMWKGPVLDRIESERVMEITVPTYRQLSLYNLQKIYASRQSETATR